MCIRDRNETLIGQDLRAAFPGFEQVLNDDNGYFGTKVNRVGVLVIYQDVEGTDWKLVQAVPRRTLLNSSGSLFLFMLLALLLLIIFSVIFSAIQNHTIIHPIYSCLLYTSRCV